MSRRGSAALRVTGGIHPVVAALLAVLFAIAPAAAQSNRSGIGCEGIGDQVKSLTLAELERMCGFKPSAAPTQPPGTPPGGFAPTTPPSATLTTPPVIPPPPSITPGLPRPPTTPVAPPVDTRRFAAYEGLDIDGQDYDKRKDVTLQECMAACHGNAICKAFAYDKWNRWCFLKHTDPITFRREPKAIVAINDTIPARIDPNRPTLIQKYPGMRFDDAGFEQVSVSGYDECHARCDANQRCEVFTFSTVNRQCKLIARPGEPLTRQPGVISGIKRQLP